LSRAGAEGFRSSAPNGTFLWIGFLNDLFYGRSHIAALAELSIPFLLDEKSTVVPVRLAAEQSGGKRKQGGAGVVCSAILHGGGQYKPILRPDPQQCPFDIRAGDRRPGGIYA